MIDLFVNEWVKMWNCLVLEVRMASSVVDAISDRGEMSEITWRNHFEEVSQTNYEF